MKTTYKGKEYVTYRIINRTTGEVYEYLGNHGRCRYRRHIKQILEGSYYRMKCTFTPHQCVIDRA